jgi:hypothetical protein
LDRETAGKKQRELRVVCYKKYWWLCGHFVANLGHLSTFLILFISFPNFFSNSGKFSNIIKNFFGVSQIFSYLFFTITKTDVFGNNFFSKIRLVFK